MLLVVQARAGNCGVGLIPAIFELVLLIQYMNAFCVHAHWLLVPWFSHVVVVGTAGLASAVSFEHSMDCTGSAVC